MLKKIILAIISGLFVIPILAQAGKAQVDGESAWLIKRVTEEENKFEDISGAWCEKYVGICNQTGLLQGRTETYYDEKSLLTNAQIVVITARFYNRLTGQENKLDAETGEAWYLPSYRLLQSIMPEELEEAYYFTPNILHHTINKPCTRQTFATFLAGVLKSADVDLTKKNIITGIPDSEDRDVRMLYEAGILTGKDRYGRFEGESSLTRGHAAAMLARVVDPVERVSVNLIPFNFSEQILSMQPETILFGVEDKAVTAEQFGEILVETMLQETMVQGRAPTEAVKEKAIENYCKEEIAPELLALKLGITLLEEDYLRAKEEGEEKDGYKGKRAAIWQNESLSQCLRDRLQMMYKNVEEYNEAIEAICDEIKVEKAEELDKVNVETVYAKYIEFFL